MPKTFDSEHISNLSFSLSVKSRHQPNILFCGTPGTGKTTHAQRLCQLHFFNHLSIGDIIKKYHCHEGKDEFWDAYIVDEIKVCMLLRKLEKDLLSGGVVLDWHVCSIFPENWIDLVVVLRTDHTILWDRLVERQYSLRKIQENNEAEIMQVVLDEAVTSFGLERVMVLTSDTLDQVEENVTRISQWIQEWRSDNQS